jgi:hypothetical protein
VQSDKDDRLEQSGGTWDYDVLAERDQAEDGAAAVIAEEQGMQELFDGARPVPLALSSAADTAGVLRVPDERDAADVGAWVLSLATPKGDGCDWASEVGADSDLAGAWCAALQLEAWQCAVTHVSL